MPSKSVRGKSANRKAKSVKPPKVKGSPLTPHATGQYCARLAGKLRYFGKDHDEALRKYLSLKAGFDPDDQRLSVASVCNRFLDAQQLKVDAGTLAKRTLGDYHAMAKRFASKMGRDRKYEELLPMDFAALRASYKWNGSSTINREITMVKTMVNWAEKSGYGRPNMGPDFVSVPKRVQRVERRAKGEMMFTAFQCHQLIDRCSPQVRAMCFLGLNLGFGPSDCSKLCEADIDWDRQWYSHVRSKTGETREGWLWPETIEALREAIDCRPKPKSPDDEDLVFVTKYGNRWVRDGSSDNPLSKEISKRLKEIGIHRAGLSYYSLRRTHRTVADNARDTTAARRVMGHVAKSNDMDDVYVQRINPKRVKAVCEHVRRWFLAGRYRTVRVQLPADAKAFDGGAK